MKMKADEAKECTRNYHRKLSKQFLDRLRSRSNIKNNAAYGCRKDYMQNIPHMLYSLGGFWPFIKIIPSDEFREVLNELEADGYKIKLFKDIVGVHLRVRW